MSNESNVYTTCIWEPHVYSNATPLYEMNADLYVALSLIKTTYNRIHIYQKMGSLEDGIG